MGLAAPLYHIEPAERANIGQNSLAGHAVVLLRADKFSMSRSTLGDEAAFNGFYTSVQTHSRASRQIGRTNAYIKAPGMSGIGSVFRNGTGMAAGRHGSLTLFLDDEVVDKQGFMVEGIRETEMHWNVIRRDRLKPQGDHMLGATFGRIEDAEGSEYLSHPGR